MLPRETSVKPAVKNSVYAKAVQHHLMGVLKVVSKTE